MPEIEYYMYNLQSHSAYNTNLILVWCRPPTLFLTTELLLEKNKLDLLYHNDTIVMLLYTISSLALLHLKRKGKMELLLPHGLNNSSYAC